MDKSYAQKAVEAVRDIPHDARRVYLWEFPPEDFEAYQAMPDTPRLKSHGHYLAVIAAMQADLEGRGTRSCARANDRGNNAGGIGKAQLAQ